MLYSPEFAILCLNPGAVALLVFIDESGTPHPNDGCSRPLILAVCISESDVRYVTGRIYSLKRQILGNEDAEIKANKLLNRSTFRRIPDKREFVEAFFDILRDMPITMFAMIMERPLVVPPLTPILPSQFRFLLERINLFSESRNEMATILFDGDGKSQYGGLAVKFSNYLHRSVEGRSYSRITDSPFFVDSKITAGIQIADMAAGVVRLYEENGLFHGALGGDSFLNAIRRYYNVVESKTLDHVSPSGYPRHGFYRMPEREHYSTVAEDRPEETA